MRRERSSDPLRRAAAAMCREALQLDGPLDAEVWASTLLGSWWPPPFEAIAARRDPDRELGGPLVDELKRIGGPGGLAALLALGDVSDSELGVRALEHVNALLAAGVERPPWGQAILEVEVLRTAVMLEDVFDDGRTIFIEAAHGDGERHAIGVYIDHNLGGMAKDILLAGSLDEVEELLAANAGERAHPRLEPIETGEAHVRIRDAMELTDMTLEAPVGEDYAALRALAMLRMDELAGPFPEIATPELSNDAREELCADFLASPEGERFAPDSAEAFVASLAIDFCADYVDGRPLRWSPVTVEVFMTGWVARKVVADRPTFEAVPGALDAWLRYAGRRRGMPAWAIEESCEAIATFTDEMFEQVDGDVGGGPASELLTAARTAGVDFTDEEAVATFIAGWNARSGLDER